MSGKVMTLQYHAVLLLLIWTHWDAPEAWMRYSAHPSKHTQEWFMTLWISEMSGTRIMAELTPQVPWCTISCSVAPPASLRAVFPWRVNVWTPVFCDGAVIWRAGRAAFPLPLAQSGVCVPELSRGKTGVLLENAIPAAPLGVTEQFHWRHSTDYLDWMGLPQFSHLLTESFLLNRCLK